MAQWPTPGHGTPVLILDGNDAPLGSASNPFSVSDTGVTGVATAANQTSIQGTYGTTTANNIVVLDPATGIPIVYSVPTQVLQSLASNKTDAVVTLTGTTAETTLLAQVASTFLDLYSIIASNSSGTATELTFRDTTSGSARFYIYCPAGDTRGFMLTESAAWKQATVNTNWTVQSSASITSIKIAAQFVKNTTHA